MLYGTFAATRRCLPRLLDARAPAPVKLAALRSLIAFADREVGSLLLEAWPTLDAEARRESLVWFRPADRQALLVEAMEQGRVSPAEIGASPLWSLAIRSPHCDAAVGERRRSLEEGGARFVTGFFTQPTSQAAMSSP